MTPAVYRVRELVVSYSPIRQSLPVSDTGRLVTPRAAAALARGLLADAPVEKMIALHLSAKHHLIAVHVVSTGTLDTTNRPPAGRVPGRVVIECGRADAGP